MQSLNRIIERAHNGEKALGLDMQYPAPQWVEVAARMGFDYISIDGQHGVVTHDQIETICSLADGYGITPVMRVPDGEESTLFLFLDRGMKMITVPNLQTAEQAEQLVRQCFYGPLGRRSATSMRVILSSGGDSRDSREFFNFTNENTIVVPQLESKEAFDNLDEILEVDGLGYFAGGPEDIAQSMGYHGQPDHPACVAAFENACAKVRAAGKQMISDITESIDVFQAVYGAGKILLEKHGRECKLKF